MTVELEGRTRWLDFRIKTARRWRRFAARVNRWISPSYPGEHNCWGCGTTLGVERLTHTLFGLRLPMPVYLCRRCNGDSG